MKTGTFVGAIVLIIALQLSLSDFSPEAAFLRFSRLYLSFAGLYAIESLLYVFVIILKY
jgi:hypothetical protein